VLKHVAKRAQTSSPTLEQELTKSETEVQYPVDPRASSSPRVPQAGVLRLPGSETGVGRGRRGHEATKGQREVILHSAPKTIFVS